MASQEHFTHALGAVKVDKKGLYEMNSAATSSPQFLTRSSLLPGEYRADFRQIDRDAIRLVRSKAARQVTSLMGHIYLCLVDAPLHMREREGVIRFAGEVREGKVTTAWEQLTELLEVADGTAHKALRWMAEQKLIGYHAGKNGVGIRIFLNRAVNSVRQESERKQKNLRLAPVANDEGRISPDEMPFNNYYREIVDADKEFPAPKNGADFPATVECSSDQSTNFPDSARQTAPLPKKNVPTSVNHATTIIPSSALDQLRAALEPHLRTIAAQAATNAATREHERTRQWLDQHGLPKAARVAQREAYSVFKHQSAKINAAERARADLQVGRAQSDSTHAPKAVPLTLEEITDIAETCIALLETQGKKVDATLAEISSGGGGWLLAEDAPKVREEVERLISARG